MGLHKPTDRSFFVIGGNVITNGRSLDLAKGQLGLFDQQDVSKRGFRAVTSLAGMPKDSKLAIKLGRHQNLPVTRSQTNKHYSSFPFAIKDVLKVDVSAPERTEQRLDEIIIGYDGIDAATSFKLRKGDYKKISVKLEGELLGFVSGTTCSEVSTYLNADICPPASDCDTCDPCEDVNCLPATLAAIEDLKEQEVRGGIKVKDLLDITPVRQCNVAGDAEVLQVYDFYTLEVCDTGDESALADVQSQYPGMKVERVKRVGANSTYKLMILASLGAPLSYEQSIASVIKGCDACPAGYTEVAGGLVYSVSLEDGGADLSAVVEGISNSIAGTAVKHGQDSGTGYYTVLLSLELNQGDLDTFVVNNPTATVQKVGEASAICTNGTVSSFDWVIDGSCEASVRQYTIVLPDNDCGVNRLEELQTSFPDFDVQLEGSTGGCQTKYIATVFTNIVCEECDPIFKDSFRAEMPEPYDQVEWEPVDFNLGSDCLCGIRIKAKEFKVVPTECIRDEVQYVESAIKIQAAAGYLTEVREGIGPITDDSIKVTWLSRWEPRTHVGGNFWQDEDRSRMYFSGEARHVGDNVAKIFKEEESHIITDAQYVDYAITVRRNIYAQSYGDTHQDHITYHILVEVGKHAQVEQIVNTLAGAAGLPSVQAFSA